MKILQVGSALYDWGGIERYLVYLNEGLEARGNEIWLAAPPGSPLFQNSSGRKVPIALGSQFQMTKLAAYMRLFRQGKFDVVNVHFGRDFIVPAVAAKLAGQKNLILTRHLVLTWSKSRVRRYNRLYGGFIGVSGAVAERLIASGIPEERVRVARSGSPSLELNLTEEEAKSKAGVKGFSVGFFGRIVEDKGVRMLTEAARLLPDVEFHVYGDGPLLKTLKALNSPVKFHGRISDVADAMAAMDLIAIPSQWEEAFCYSALEAMSLGKPIVATKTGGLPEQVVNSETGFLVDRNDLDGFVESIKRLHNDPTLMRSFGTKALERHREHFGIASMAERVENAYKELSEQKV